jgi:hypothetical protein
MDESEIILAVEIAIRKAVHDQQDHLRLGRVERNFTVHLVDKLAPLFVSDDICVDAFYNRHGQITKKLDGKTIELDIAIHKRGSDECNILAIELEVNNKPARDDVWKVQQLTKLEGYGYCLGLFLVVGISERAGELIAMEWYKNGERIN